ncbi:MAG: galactokinase [Candidatus Aminicenantes bacterium]|nr:MAG: galactokinase [Candidatus Aminicenantes bacterium]
MERTLIPIFERIFGMLPEVFAFAPGRINIIGEHTDYNLGYVLPAALNLRNYFFLSRRPDDQVSIWAENFKKKEEFSLTKISFTEDNQWVNYIKGVLWVLEEKGFKLQGINGLIWGNVPLEAGLSSSAALEVSIVHGLDTLFELCIEPLEKVKIARKAENEFVGVQCGIMDQFVSVFGQERMALFLDCESLDYKLFPLRMMDAGLRIVVYETGVRRELASSEYNRRRIESAQALDVLKKSGVQQYKDATLGKIEEMKNEMNDVVFRRARHVISENQRVRDAVLALEKDDFIRLGELISQSHESLRDDYEVSCPELDLLYEVAQEFPDCFGARLTGAGFGGSGIALVKIEGIAAFKEKLRKDAEKKGFPRPTFYEVEVGGGAQAYFLSEEKE